MKKTAQMFASLVIALASHLAAGSANAQNVQSWVSSTGSGIACTRAAPCASFGTAYAATIPGGVISVLDSGDYGSISIQKSLTIRAVGVDAGATFTPAISGNWITVGAGASDVVTLEGLHFTGAAAVDFQTGGQLHVVRCVISNGNLGGAAGIRFRPSNPSKLSVTETVISNMGSVTGGGIVINPRSGGSAQVALERVTVNGNAYGIAADGTGSTAGINVTIADSMIAHNAHAGILATTPSGGAPIGVMVKSTKSVNNNIGIWSVGTNVTVRVDGSSVIGNTTGLSFGSGGALLTFGNNSVVANGSNGAFSGSVGLQ